jgi:predicted GH43/DUF377 family glycosyl hydrolase
VVVGGQTITRARAGTVTVTMSWTRQREVLTDSGPLADLDRLRSFRPSVLEADNGTLRMWYSGHDGSTGRILEAVQEPGQPWQRLGISLDSGSSGASDSFGVEAPSVVRTPVGFLMAYAGSDGADTRLHMAASDDGHRWEAQGTFMQRGEPDAIGATHPCLVVTGERWWLYYAGYDGSDNGRRAAIMAAVSRNGASWDRIGPVVDPARDEVAVSEPWVLVRHRHFTMFYVSDDGTRTAIDMATSDNGVTWDRRGTTLAPGDVDDASGHVRSPTAIHLNDGHLRLWYASHTAGDPADGYHLWSADQTTAQPQPPAGDD